MVALTLEGQFLAQLDFIDKVVASTCRQHGMFGDDAEDFKSSVHEKMIDDDYGVFRKFRGNSSLETYLTAVIQNRFRDYRIHKWGKWRPSAKAKRMGTAAIQLETLLYRDGRSVDEAIQITLDGGDGNPSRDDLVKMAAELPQRAPRRLEGDDKLAEVPGTAATNGLVLHQERGLTQTRMESGLEHAIAKLEDEDQVIMRMRYLDGLSVADVARGLGLDQKPLYARINSNLARLRGVLEREGVTAGDVRDLLE